MVRGKGEGSVYRRNTDGRWVGSIHIGTDGTGKRQRRAFYGDTQSAVIKKMKAAQATIAKGAPLTPERTTVATVLERWLAHVQPSVREATYIRYEEHCRLHIAPTLGNVRLKALTPRQVQELLDAKAAAGFSQRTVQYIRTTLRAALAQSAGWGEVAINAAALTKIPKVERAPVEGLSIADARAVLKAIESHPKRNVYVVALSTGLRQGELLGLRWIDVELDRPDPQIRVTANLQIVSGEFALTSPKTELSRRTIRIGQTAAQALRDERRAQLERRLASAGAWQDKWGLVFTTPDGRPLLGQTVTRQFQRALEDAGLPRQKFHNLRHGAATLLLAQGLPMKMVQETLGHATIAITADVYTHILPQLKKEAADAMDAALGGTL